MIITKVENGEYALTLKGVELLALIAIIATSVGTGCDHADKAQTLSRKFLSSLSRLDEKTLDELREINI